MIFMLLSALIMVFSLQFFTLNYQIQGLNRAIVSTPIELMYQDVVTTESGAGFESEQIKSHLISYYDKTITRYTEEYDVSFYFYQKSDHSMCLDDRCDGVEITVNCKLILDYEYNRVMYYQITRSNYGQE